MDNNYQLSRIHNYINGLMSREEMHALEREALDDPFLQDALDGYALQDGVDAKQLSLLQKRLANRVETYGDRRDRRFFGWQRLAIGATAAVMFVTVCILLTIKFLPRQSSSSLTEVEIMQEDTYTISIRAVQSDALPAEGWANYQQYLNQHFNNVAQREGLIRIKFAVDERGNAYNILERTEKGTIAVFAELRQIIADGPKWSGSSGEIELDLRKTRE